MRNDLSQRGVDQAPRIVNLSSKKYRKREIADVKAQGVVDYQLSKPFQMKDFIKMCKAVNYDYKASAAPTVCPAEAADI